MLHTTVFSTHFTNQKLWSIFLGARFNRVPRCENCNSDRVYKPNDTTYRCRRCWSQFRLETGTFLARKRLSFRLWYDLVYGFAVGLSARRLQRILHLPDYRIVYGAYRTIRAALIQESEHHRQKFTGTVEVDESYYGGAFKNLRKETLRKFRLQGLAKRGRGAKVRKQPVFGIFKRDGKIYLELIPDAQQPTLEQIIKRRVRKHEHVFSDTHTGYQGLVAMGYIHRTINHGDEEYVNGTVHINGMEGFWGLSKTNMHTYKGIRKRNWNEYLKEMEFRYNERSLSLMTIELEQKMAFLPFLNRLVTIGRTIHRDAFVG